MVCYYLVEDTYILQPSNSIQKNATEKFMHVWKTYKNMHSSTSHNSQKPKTIPMPTNYKINKYCGISIQ